MARSSSIRARIMAAAVAVVTVGAVGLTSAGAGAGVKSAHVKSSARSLKPKTTFTPTTIRSVRVVPRGGRYITSIAHHAIFRPTMGAAAYARAKAQAAARASAALRKPGTQRPPIPRSVTVARTFAGSNQNNSSLFAPPDTIGAVSKKQFVETVNNRFSVYSRGGTQIKRESLNAFFGVSSPLDMFDPRVVYDSSSGRWYISADQFTSIGGQRYLRLAVSRTSDATRGWFFYRFNTDVFGDDFFDFPMLGYNTNSIIITGNRFLADGGGAFSGADVLVMSKRRAISGRAPSVTDFGNVFGSTLASTIVRGNSAKVYLLGSFPTDSAVGEFLLNTASGVGPALTFWGAVSVTTSFSPPPAAPQPTTTSTIDTSDSRFSSDSYQVGSSIYNVHSVSNGGVFPIPYWYQIDTVSATQVHQDFFFQNGSSYDYNASLAVSGPGFIFATWTASDSVENPAVLVTDLTPGVDISTGGTIAFTSPSNCDTCGNTASGTVQRWGDYSTVSIDPAATGGNAAFIINESVLAPGEWGTEVAKITSP